MNGQFQLEKVLIFVAGIFFLFYLAYQIGEGDILLPLAVATLAAAAWVFFKLGHNIWILIPIALVNPIPLGFLPIKFKAVELAFLMLLAYLLIVHAAMKHRRFDFGPRELLVPFSILLGIIMFHQLQGGIGLKVLGSEAAGARRHLLFFIAAAFYVALLSIQPRNWQLLRRLPSLYFWVMLLGTAPTIFCIYFPEIAMPLGLFNFVVNIDDAINYYGGGAVQRVGSWGPLAIALQLLLVSRYPLPTWFQLNRLWIPLVSLAALFLCFLSGFRSNIFYFLVVTGVASVISLRWRCLVFLVPSLLLIAFMVVGNGRWFNLPGSVQRALSFLPGQWDAVAMADAIASSEFRRNIRNVYMDQYAANSPWFGNGCKIDIRDAGASVDPAFAQSYEAIDGFIRRKDFHIGWISAYDTVGIIGFVAFIWLCLAIAWFARRQILAVGPAALEPVQMWVVCYLAKDIIGFFTVFGDLANVMPSLLFGAGVMVLVLKEMPATRPVAPSPAVQPVVSLFTGRRFA
jgi:hypothetical protein